MMVSAYDCPKDRPFTEDDEAAEDVVSSYSQFQPFTSEEEKLQHSIDSTYHHALQCLDQWPNADVTAVTDYLKRSEEALLKKDFALAKAYYARARMWCARLDRKSGDLRRWGGAAAIVLQFVYLALLALGGATYYWSRMVGLPPMLTPLETTADFIQALFMSTETIRIPFYALVWGFVGGIAWCLYSAAYWTGKGLFNNNYLGWYVALPVVAALLGTATSTIILAGLTAIAVPFADPHAWRLTDLPFTLVATICLVSFACGYCARTIWKLLDRTVRRIFNDEDELQTVQSSVGSSIVTSTLEQEIRSSRAGRGSQGISAAKR